MPLLDHFHPPLNTERRWESFHSNWATKIADALTEHWLPANYFAEEHVRVGSAIEIDVGTFERDSSSGNGTDTGGVATLKPRVWAPPAPDAVLPAVFPDTFEVRIHCTDTGPRLVAAIELVSPSNKDRLTERRAFANKCAGYLAQGISVVVVDIVTSKHFNLHDEVVEVMNADASYRLSSDTHLYAVAYR